jgi:hypothetical protein
VNHRAGVFNPLRASAAVISNHRQHLGIVLEVPPTCLDNFWVVFEDEILGQAGTSLASSMSRGTSCEPQLASHCGQTRELPDDLLLLRRRDVGFAPINGESSLHLAHGRHDGRRPTGRQNEGQGQFTKFKWKLVVSVGFAPTLRVFSSLGSGLL